MAEIHTLVVGQLQTNCYVITSRNEAILVDPGDEPERILRFVKNVKATLTRIVATHTHFDHILGVDDVRNATKIQFLIHRDDLPVLQSMQSRVRQFLGFDVPPPPTVDGYLKDSDSLKLGDEMIHVLHTPGHSPGSISLFGNGYVLTGDALFNQSIGRTDLPGETSTRSSIRLGRSSSNWTITPPSIPDMDPRLQSVMKSLQIHSLERLQGCRSGNHLICPLSLYRSRTVIV